MRIVGKRIEKQVRRRDAGPDDPRSLSIFGAKITRSGSMPRAEASRRRLSCARSLISESHNTLPGTRANSRIQTSNIAALILNVWLKQQKTKPWSGGPRSLRGAI